MATQKRLQTVIPKKAMSEIAVNSEQIEEGVAPAPKPTAARLKRISDIAQRQLVLLREIAALEAQLEAKQRALAANQDVELAKAMLHIGMDSFELTGGIPVEFQRNVRAGIPSFDKQPELHREGIAYMESKAPQLVKRQAILEYEKGMDKKKQAVMKKIWKAFLSAAKKSQLPLSVVTKDAVNASSLGKWVRGQDVLGNSVPEEILGVFRSQKAVVKLPELAKSK